MFYKFILRDISLKIEEDCSACILIVYKSYFHYSEFKMDLWSSLKPQLSNPILETISNFGHERMTPVQVLLYDSY